MNPPARFKLTESEWTAVRAEMYAELIALAKARQIITYSDLALRLPSVYVHPGSYAFTRLLGEICDLEEEAGRGMICALVVSKATGMPGAGYFRGAAHRGRDVSDLDRCWQEECERVFDAWANAD
ncbi:MAG: hypothetical protein IPK19_04480 [Chloroflexi bacterium]|nr:hypothetical protein [Chloroflexota bacterium]